MAGMIDFTTTNTFQGFDFTGEATQLVIDLVGIRIKGKPDFTTPTKDEVINSIELDNPELFSFELFYRGWIPNPEKANKPSQTIITWSQEKALNSSSNNNKWDLRLKECKEIDTLKEILPRVVWGNPVGGIGVGLPFIPNKIINLYFVQIALTHSLSFIIEQGWNKTIITGVTIEYKDNKVSEPIIMIQEQKVS